jgi:negative regulator of sigma-B (phosphoserine phosphatase)
MRFMDPSAFTPRAGLLLPSRAGISLRLPARLMTIAQRPPSRPPPSSGTPTVWSSAPGGPSVSVAWLSRPRVGEIASGDAVVVRQLGSAVLIGVIDALGHGPKAAEVAKSATGYLTSVTAGDVPVLVRGLHQALQGSRGAAALTLILSASGIEACSVGNVELRSVTNKLPFVLTPGVFGVRLRQPRISNAAAPIVDRFALFSDGISGRFDLRSLRGHSPAELVSHVFATHRHAHDDATIVVVDVG